MHAGNLGRGQRPTGGHFCSNERKAPLRKKKLVRSIKHAAKWAMIKRSCTSQHHNITTSQRETRAKTRTIRFHDTKEANRWRWRRPGRAVFCRSPAGRRATHQQTVLNPCSRIVRDVWKSAAIKTNSANAFEEYRRIRTRACGGPETRYGVTTVLKTHFSSKLKQSRATRCDWISPDTAIT